MMTRVAALLVLVGCGDNLPEYAEPKTIDLTFPSVPNRKLDLLFQLDDTGGAPDKLANLARALPDFLAQLRAPTGELPDLRIGIVTSDLGTLGSDVPSPGPAIGQIGNGGCTGAGREGRLQTFGAAVADVFLVDEQDTAGGRRRNYQGELGDVLGMMIRGAGGGGCGFEQPLHAIRRSLAHPSNAGFLRPEAHLGVIIFADEDDCSFRDPQLMSTDESALGPLQSFRCTRFGVQCDQPMEEVGPKTGCGPREDSPLMEGIEVTRALLKTTKRDPSMLSVAAIIGVPTPVAVELRAPPGGGTPMTALAHSCRFDTGFGEESSDPGVRIAALVREFGGRGVITSICKLDLAPAMLDIGRVLKHPLGVVCLDSTQLTDSSTERGIQPSCELTEIIGDVENRLTDFQITADATACPETADHLRIVVRGTSTTPGAYVRARCETPY